MPDLRTALRPSKKIFFTKMQGLGNDFVVIDATQQPVELTTEQIRRLADRRYGVGCDQVLILRPATTPNVDFAYQIFNTDGTVAEQCGNGARCLGRYIHTKKLTSKSAIHLAAPTTEIEIYCEAGGLITVQMECPVFVPAEIPFQAVKQAEHYDLPVADEVIRVGVVALGNPHAVLLVPDVTKAPVEIFGAAIGRHPQFPQQANVGFMQIIDRQHIRLRVYERGVGETLACGSGACAAVVIGHLWQQLDSSVVVDLAGGRLHIRWQGANTPVWMSGPAESVFEGYIAL